jgi:hypothetical protein
MYTLTCTDGRSAARRNASHSPEDRWKLKVEQITELRAPSICSTIDGVSRPASAKGPGKVHS